MKYRAREREDVLAFVRRYTVRLVEFNSIQIRFEWQQQAKNNNNYNTRQHRGKPTINNNNKKFINKYWNAFESKCTLRIRVHCTRYISFVIFLFLIYEPKKLNQRKRTFIDIRVRFNIIYLFTSPSIENWCVYLYSAWLHLFLSLGSCALGTPSLFVFVNTSRGRTKTTITIATILYSHQCDVSFM